MLKDNKKLRKGQDQQLCPSARLRITRLIKYISSVNSSHPKVSKLHLYIIHKASAVKRGYNRNLWTNPTREMESADRRKKGKKKNSLKLDSVMESSRLAEKNTATPSSWPSSTVLFALCLTTKAPWRSLHNIHGWPDSCSPLRIPKIHPKYSETSLQWQDEDFWKKQWSKYKLSKYHLMSCFFMFFVSCSRTSSTIGNSNHH